jgi:hypothetical protein
MKYSKLDLGQIETICNKLGGMPGVKRFLANETIVVERPRPVTAEPRVMKVLRPATLPTPKPFSVAETFLAKKPTVKFYVVIDNFKSAFGGIVEEAPIEATLKSYDLVQAAGDDAIIEDLGGKASAAVALSQVWRLLERQGSGEAGVLFTNEYANIFYCYDVEGVLRTVSVAWYDRGWFVHANSLGQAWSERVRVFSRNS